METQTLIDETFTQKSPEGRNLYDPTRKEISMSRQSMVSAVRWSWFDEIGYKPNRFQWNMHESDARFRTSCAGRRGGKTEWAGREGSAYMVAGPFRVWIVAGSYELGEREFRVIENALSHPANHYKMVERTYNKKAGQMHIKLSNGAEVDVISIDKPRKSAHGEEVDLIILSEAGLMDNIGGEGGVWNKTLIGAMSTRMAEVITPTTPQGEDDFLYPMFMKGLIPNSPLSTFRLPNGKIIDLIDYYKYSGEYDPSYFSLQWPSWANIEGYNEDVAHQFKTLPFRIFMEQVAGFFVKWSGSIWLNDFCYDPNKHIIEPLYIPQWWRRIEVIDPGFSGMFAWIAAYVDDMANIYVVDEYTAQRTLFKDHVEEIKRRRTEFFYRHQTLDAAGISTYREGYIPVYVDPEDPQCRAELNQLGLMCLPADNDVVGGFQSGGTRFKAGTLRLFASVPKLDKALRNHEWARSKQQGGKIKEANDAWKHLSDCLRYLVMSGIWAAENPNKVVEENLETVGDMLNTYRQGDKNVLDLSIADWERLHAA